MLIKSNYKSQNYIQNLILIGHRGMGITKTKNIKENTLFSFFKAYLNKIKAIEFDVVMTKDKKLVINHNMSIENKEIRKMTLLEIKEIKSEEIKLEEKKFKEIKEISKKPITKQILFEIPNLEDLFEFLPEEMIFNIEIKIDLKISIENKYKEEITKEILKVCNKYKNRKVFFSSFSLFICEFLQNKNLEVFFLVESLSLEKYKEEKIIKLLRNINGLILDLDKIESFKTYTEFCKENKKMIFAYGKSTNKKEIVKKYLKHYNENNLLTGIIIDDINVYKDIKLKVY